MLTLFMFAGIAGLSGETAPADEPLVLRLWAADAPGAVGTGGADIPTLTVSFPARDRHGRTAILICPGGGYGSLALDHEGRQIARWCDSLGVTACILRYRHAPRYRHPAPLRDAQRALRTIRSRAAEWNLEPDRIGVIGFSAGGHLASTTGTQFDKGDPGAADAVERVSCRPDFMILCYPVISLDAPYAHQGSRRNLLGPEPGADAVARLSNEKHVTPDTPPAFLFHTDADKGVLPENSIAFYMALRAAGVPAELHIYERGPHGVGLAPGDDSLKTWPGLCANWMRLHGWLE